MRGVGFIALFLLLFACSGREETIGLSLSIPQHFPPFPSETFPALTEEGIALGKMLFHDPVLSGDSSIACSSCHFPERAFGDSVAFSKGGFGAFPTLRNTPPLFNLAWQKAFFWDGGAKNLESQTFGPIQHPHEMAGNLKEIIATLQNKETYKKAFQKAFGEDTITSSALTRALAQYQRSLISAGSRYDRWKVGEATLDETELAGLNLFQNYCSNCHNPPLFTDFAYHNIGLDSLYPPDEEGIYLGRFRISYDSADLGAYKTPSLRNLAFTYPYMHDGRFQTLEEVINHFSGNHIHGRHVSEQLPPSGFPLDEKKKKALMAFLNTLNDSSFVEVHQSR